MEHYDEYLQRVNWKPSEPLHNWTAARIVENFTSKTGHLVDWSSPELQLVEIGTGTGRIAKVIRDTKLCNYRGVEPNPKIAQHARALGFDISEESLPNLQESWRAKFDATISLHVLEHAPTYLDAREWLKEMKRITKEGGVILVAAPDIRDYGNYFWESDWSHGWPTTPQRVRQIMDDLDLKIIFEGSLHLGSTSRVAAVFSHMIDLLLPTRTVDALTRLLVRRPLASGLKIATIWGLTFVVGQK